MAEAKISIRDYLKIIQKRRHTVLTVFAVFFALVLIVTFSSAPVYKASTKLMIEKVEAPTLLSNNYYGSYDPEFYETQYQVIKSAAVSKKAVKMLSLDRTYENYFKKHSSQFSLSSAAAGWFTKTVSALSGARSEDDLSTKESEGDSRADIIAKKISAGIIVRPVLHSKIVEISYQSTNPEFARLIADTVAKAYMDELLEFNMSSTRATLEWMSKKADEERLKLEASEKALQQYTNENHFLTFNNKMTIMPQQINDLAEKLVQAEMEILNARVNRVADNMREAETLPVIAADAGVRSVQDLILRAEKNLVELSQKYGKKHPVMLRATEDLNELKKKREREIKRVIETVKNEFELAGSNESNLRRMLAEAKGEALNLNEKYTEYDALNREVETNKQVYDALVKKMSEQSATDQQRTVNVLIVENAEAPKVPVKPRKAFNLIIGLLTGLLGGIGTAFFLEKFDNKLKNPEEVETRFAISVLGIIPVLSQTGKTIEKIVLNEPASAQAENYKAIRTSLLLSSAENPPKRILITSPNSEEGKTTTAINLAIAIAQSGQKVLLIDADMRKPRLHKVFGLDNARGLSTFLAGAFDANVIQKGPVQNLGFIPCGPIPPNPSELLGSVRMRAMLMELSGEPDNGPAKLFLTASTRFDIIIIDSPPVLAVTDTLILSTLVNGTVLVGSAEKTTYEDMKKSLKSLASVNARVIGGVINAVDLKKDGYHYYQYAGYYYASTDEPKA
jgi:capsular exopolysaccharide synthesis family protein